MKTLLYDPFGALYGVFIQTAFATITDTVNGLWIEVGYFNGGRSTMKIIEGSTIKRVPSNS